MIIEKHEVKKSIRMSLYSKAPSFVPRFTNLLLRDVMIYIEGYIEGMKEDMTPPINNDEFKELVLNKALSYVFKELS